MSALAIIVPVFNAAGEIQRCLASLARCAPAGAQVLLYDDGSTDPAIAPMLARFAASHPGARVLPDAANRGFIAACNAAATQAAPGSDLLFLNSDTELTMGAIEEMQAVLEARGAAICCPMSSNARFLSVPLYQQPNALPSGWSAEDMAREVRTAAGDERVVAIPTPIGFCMLVRRDAWDACGPFDPAYGRGYGEEDDLGQRALAAGRLVVAAMRAYVWHRGGASFVQSEALARSREANNRLLASRWPDYALRVGAFCKANPLRPMQERLWHALLGAPARTRHVLHLAPRREHAGALRERLASLVRAAGSFAIHTIVVPAADTGAWVDAVDLGVGPGARMIGLIGIEANLARFLAASPATHVHAHAAHEWNCGPLIAIAGASGRPVLVSQGDEPDAEQCAAWYRA